MNTNEKRKSSWAVSCIWYLCPVTQATFLLGKGSWMFQVETPAKYL